MKFKEDDLWLVGSSKDLSQVLNMFLLKLPIEFPFILTRVECFWKSHYNICAYVHLLKKTQLPDFICLGQMWFSRDNSLTVWPFGPLSLWPVCSACPDSFRIFWVVCYWEGCGETQKLLPAWGKTMFFQVVFSHPISEISEKKFLNRYGVTSKLWVEIPLNIRNCRGVWELCFLHLCISCRLSNWWKMHSNKI